MRDLDTMTVEELIDFEKQCEADTPLQLYANRKRRALQCRLAGDIGKALEHEAHCDALYGLLWPCAG